jgi:hypothetical protein
LETESAPVAQDLLSTLCQGNEELHDAMSYFLYLRPEEQIARLGTTEQLVQRAMEEIERGDLLKARVDYTDAAWIELYRGNKAGVRASLEKALSLGDGDGLARQSAARLNNILVNLDRVISIARRYYHKGGTESAAECADQRVPILVSVGK